MCKGLLQEVLRLILTHTRINIRIGVLHFHLNRRSLLESVLFDGITNFLHDGHEPLAE